MSRGTKKTEGQSWFYHAPQKSQQNAEPVPAPPSSQIPGLNGEPEMDEFEEPRRGMLRDTDSDYVRMAKMGGRPDLLKTREPKTRNDHPVGYARPEWFYLEDNRQEDEQEKYKQQKEWEFMLPDYMVHQGQNVPQSQGHNTRSAGSRHPFVHSEETAAEREGGQLKDKTVAIPETRRPGFGVRSAKMDKRGAPPAAMEPRRKPVAPQQELEPRQKYTQMPVPQYESQENNPMMSKIMSHAYVEQWHDEQSRWRQQQGRGPADRTGKTEYQNAMEMQQQQQHDPRAGSGRARVPSAPKQHMDLEEAAELEKELFKMSKFKKIPARVDSRRPEWFKQDGPTLAAQGH